MKLTGRRGQFSTLTGVTIVVGVVILAAGILIAASLRKWRKGTIRCQPS